jgi:hypothetical protein
MQTRLSQSIAGAVFCRMAAFALLLISGAGRFSTASVIKGEVPGNLFAEPASAGVARVGEERGPYILRSRQVRVRFDSLWRGAGVRLNLFDDAFFTAYADRIEWRGEDRYTWFGSLEGIEGSQVILAVEDGDMAGNIVCPGRFFEVRSLGNGLHAVYEIDQAGFPDESDALPVETGPGSQGGGVPGPGGDDGSVIDVLVVYTPAAAASSGNILSEIQLGAAETNQSYANSGIVQRVRVVAARQVAYTESGDILTDLARLTDTADGYMDVVHAWRDDFCADLVSLWIDSGSEVYCGISWAMTTVSAGFAPYAFSVVERDCATGYYSFGHEMGHNMGARHDCFVDPALSAPYDYSHGYVNWPDRWRTVMAYDDECAANGTACTRIPYFSNPDVRYNGDPTGTPEQSSTCTADNHKTLNNTARTVANFRNFASCRSCQAAGDYNNDGRADVSVYRRGAPGRFYVQFQPGSNTTVDWGSGAGVIPVPEDYNGDGATDYAIFKPPQWAVLYSSGGSFIDWWGGSTDTAVPGDYDGDGRADLGVYRCTAPDAAAQWWIKKSGGGQKTDWWGLCGPGRYPVPADYDGDGIVDIAVWSCTNGRWDIKGSRGTWMTDYWGDCTMIPAPFDFDGDLRADFAVFKPGRPGLWFIKKSSGGSITDWWGETGDIPVVSDYDGDCKADIAVFRPSTSKWYVKLSGGGTKTATWGAATDIPAVSPYSVYAALPR